MNTIKIMPCLDMKNGRVVKGVHFVDIKDAGDMLLAASVFHFRTFSIRQVKAYLCERGMKVNL